MQLFSCVVDGIVAGSGEKVDWNKLPREKNYIVAGGINLENVVELIEKVNPLMIDLASGIEENGVVSQEKIREIFGKTKLN